MSKFKYSYSSISYGEEDFTRTIDRLARFGYDGIEILGELEGFAANRVRQCIRDAGIEASSVCGMFDTERDLGHPEPSRRKHALDYLYRAADLAAAVGAPRLIVSPVGWIRTEPIASADEEWNWAVESLRMGGEYAASVGVQLSLEPWNRYENYMLNRLDQATRMWREIGLDHGGVLADTFHMAMEERSIPEAIREAAPLLDHVHLADSNREIPGGGHTDFRAVISALVESGYGGYLAFEVLPVGIGYPAAPESFDRDAETAIATMKAIEAEVEAAGIAERL